MRKTYAFVEVAMALLEQPDGRHWGYDLTKRTGVRSGVLYPILQRMLEQGWLHDGWEDRAQITGKRPPRRYYELTHEGRAGLAGIVKEVQSDARFKALVPRMAS